jgi:hypothetical protein
MTPAVTEEHIRQYRDDGYCLVEGLIPLDLVEAARLRTIEICEDTPDWPDRHFQVLDPDRYRSARGSALPVGIQRPAQQEEVFRVVADHSNMVAAMGRLLAGDVERFTDQIGVKHAAITEEQGGRSYYHQDSFYWHIDPQLGCNCWIPMSPVDLDSIALAVMPGSHRGWILIDHESYYDDPPMGHLADGFSPFKRHRIPLDQPSPSKEVLLPMRPGDGLFFTNYTWHRSEPNCSGQTRCFYAIAYQVRAG